MDLFENWKATGLLEGVAENRQKDLANCLEVQRVLNEEDNSSSETFKRCSIPIVRRTLAQTRQVFTNNFDEQTNKTHLFKTEFNPPESDNLEEEADYVAGFSEKLVLELEELFKDLPKSKINFNGFKENDGQFLMFYY